MWLPARNIGQSKGLLTVEPVVQMDFGSPFPMEGYYCSPDKRKRSVKQ